MAGPRPLPEPSCSVPLVIALMAVAAITAVGVAIIVADRMLRR